MKFAWKLFMLSIMLLINACVDEHVIEVNRNLNGSMLVESEPDGARIFLLGTDTGKITPDSITNLESGLYKVTLKKEDYRDTSFAVEIFKNLRTTKFIKMKLKEGEGKIIIYSLPDKAQIYLNKNFTGKTTPDSLVHLRKGIYNIKLSLKGYKDTTFLASLFSNKDKIVRTIRLTKNSSVAGELKGK